MIEKKHFYSGILLCFFGSLTSLLILQCIEKNSHPLPGIPRGNNFFNDAHAGREVGIVELSFI